MKVRSPGKVVVLGEYAVVDGAPAIVAAVDRGVCLHHTPGPTRQIRTPTGDDRFVRAALEAAEAPGGTWSFTDWNPMPPGPKVGLGGSAAAVVAAVVGATVARGGTLVPDPVFALAQAVHREVQGSGSGIDVAASTYGGLLTFEAGRITRLPATAMPMQRAVVVFSGTAATTGPRVERYRAWPDRARFVERSRALVAAFPEDPLGAIGEAGAALRQMAEQAGIAYWTPGIDRLVRLAEARAGAAKPSGAGGGDIVLALFPDEGRARDYARTAAAEGFLVVPVALADGALPSA